MGKRQTETRNRDKERAQKKRDEILGLHINAKNLEEMELTPHQKDLIAEIAKYWLIRHHCKKVSLVERGEHYGIYAAAGVILGLILMLVILYYLPV